MSKNKKILIIGQTPPPYGGQALMIQSLLNYRFPNVEFIHIRLNFSKDFNEMGKFKFYKFTALIKTILLAWIYRFKYNVRILYYGPAGPNKMAMYRDMLLLISIRFLFKKVIFHSHAGGSSLLYKDLNPISKYFYRIAFFKPNIIIKLTKYSHGDEDILKAKKIFIIPNGITDEFKINGYGNQRKDKKDQIINLLYTGAIYEERGIIELVEAVNLLKKKDYKICLKIIGIFIDSKFSNDINNLIEKYKLEDFIQFLGTKIGKDKWDIFYKSDIFCFPTKVPSETFGIVLIEAMQFKIPIVASKWNGIPYVIDDKSDGLLTNPSDYVDIANKIEILINNKELRYKLGENGRKKFENSYTIKSFIENMDLVFKEI